MTKAAMVLIVSREAPGVSPPSRITVRKSFSMQ
jgi:hypothetical protein